MAFTAHPQLIHLKGVCLKCKTHQGGVYFHPQVHGEKSLELQLGQNSTPVTSVQFSHPIVGKAIAFSGAKHNLQNPNPVTSVEFVHPTVGKAIGFSGAKHNL